MALKEPDMTSCTLKKRCLTGVNKGLVYDPSDPCLAGVLFNELKCDCTASEARWSGFSYHNQDGGSFFWSTGWRPLTSTFRWTGAPAHLGSTFRPVGLQAPGFTEGITVTAIGSCSGSTLGCNLVEYDENGEVLNTWPKTITIYCECPDGYDGSFAPGCQSMGTWEFRE